MANERFLPVCVYCKKEYDPSADNTADGISLCGWCRHNRTKIQTAQLTMISVLNSAYADGIRRLGDEDNERFTRIYHAHQTVPADKRDVFERKVINTIALGGPLAVVLSQWQLVRTAQREYEELDTLFEAIP